MNLGRFLKRVLPVILVLILSFSVNAQQVNILTEDFESGSTPLGWVTEGGNDANYISFESSSSNPTITNAAEGIYFVRFNSYNASIGIINSLKRIFPLSTLGLHNIVVNFKWYEDSGSSSSLDRLIVEWSANGSTWIEAGTFNRFNMVEGWRDRNVLLPSAAENTPTLYVAFKFVSAYGNNCSLDIVKINGVPDPVEAVVNGTVINSLTGLPIVGAKVTIQDSTAYTDLGGHYSMNQNVGISQVVVSKLGYDNFIDSVSVLPDTNVFDFVLFENTASPAAVLAVINSSNTAVNLTWGLPQSLYEIVYDDGGFENITSWTSAGNVNALKFTPIAQYPVSITGGKVNIGDGSYPAGGNPLVGFEMAVYDDDGALGYPGTELGRIEVTPTATGWVEFTFDAPIVINSGNFYLGMIQGGNYPNCAPIAVDETNPSMRSYSKFASGNGPWVPAGYNDFMIRAYCVGTGGPLDMATASQPLYIAKNNVSRHSLSLKQVTTTAGLEREGLYVPLVTDSPYAPEDIISYEVWRLLEINQGIPSTYSLLITSVPTTSFSDGSWPSLPNGAYKWAVRARYSYNRYSPFVLSNTVGKGWESDVTINVTDGSTMGSALGAQISMTYLTIPGSTQYDTVGITPESGSVTFPNMWKGDYTLVIKKFNYEQIGPITITIDDDVEVFNYTLMEVRYAPTNLYVDDRTLVAKWNAPKPEMAIFEEPWDGHTFATQGWIIDTYNWSVNSFGNPNISAQFNWSPQVTNYESHLTSPDITGVGSSNLFLRYDIYLDNFGTTNENQMAVEIWDGANWNRLKNYSNMGGSIDWTSESLDITAYTWDTFKFRFTAYGLDSNDINNWNIDNVAVVATLSAGKGLLGYIVYLNDIQIAFTTETTFQIPQSLCTYGQPYTLCVEAMYDSGSSESTCYTFTSQYLPAPRNLTAVGVQSSVYLNWEEPITPGKSTQVGHPNLSTNSLGEHANGVSNFIPTAQYTPSNTDAILWDNGTIINSPGTGAGGADESVIPSGGSSYGFTMNQAGPYSVADDFTVGTSWTVTSVTFQGYQTNSGTTSTFTGAYFRIYDGDPSSGGTVIWGDLTTNLMTSTNFSGIYRVNAPGEGTARPVMNIICDGLNISLAPGTYWIEWATTGSVASGPWVPNTAAAVGNSIQNTGSWAGLVNPGAIDLPFIISGNGGGGGVAPDVLVYNIYRDGTLVATVPGDVYEYYDLYLDPDEYCYTITAVYDLEPFGFPAGSTDESLEEGPACVNVNYGLLMPWEENWATSSFAFNNWSFEPCQGNWSVNCVVGNSFPAAEFNWASPETNYSYA
ncbi:MAG: carboxypeptidase-like regulatory domain-containing protein, partial [Sphingobacteriia bacterium]|nr:carboxypeptidase-like regulatory domain-containing protein [Sphingobacteriia bacterium]